MWSAVLFSYRYLKKEDYELALVPRFDADAGYGAGMLAFLSGAKKRVGYSECVLPHKMISDKGYDGFYTRLLFSKTAAVFHEVERNLDVLRYMGIFQMILLKDGLMRQIGINAVACYPL